MMELAETENWDCHLDNHFSIDLCQSLYALQQQGILCDGVIYTADGSIFVHKCVLVSGSQYFYETEHAKSFATCSAEHSNHMSSFLLTCEQHHVVEKVVKLLYTGYCQCNNQDIFSLKTLCNLLRIKWNFIQKKCLHNQTSSSMTICDSLSQSSLPVCSVNEFEKSKAVVSSFDHNFVQTEGCVENSSVETCEEDKIKMSDAHSLRKKHGQASVQHSNNSPGDGKLKRGSECKEIIAEGDCVLENENDNNCKARLASSVYSCRRKGRKTAKSVGARKPRKKSVVVSKKPLLKRANKCQIESQDNPIKSTGSDIVDSDNDIEDTSKSACITSALHRDPHEESMYIVLPGKIKELDESDNTCIKHECLKNFQNVSKLKEHYEKFPTHMKPKQCPACQDYFWNKNLYDSHRKEVHPPRQHGFSCPECCKSYRFYYRMIDHMNIKHNVPYQEHLTIYQCKVRECAFQRCNKRAVILHYTDMHSKEQCFTCEKCGKIFKSKKHLSSHLQSHLERENRAKFECGYCGTTLLSRAGLQTHINRQHLNISSKKILCHLCSYQTRDSKSLQTHMMRVHDIIASEPLRCTKCDFATYTKRLLKVHIANNHADPNAIFICNVCQKVFNSEYKLYIHRREHTIPQDVHHCPEEGCSYSSKYKKNIAQHIRTQHTEKHIKPHACPYCEYKCKIAGNLHKHIRGKHNVEVPTLSSIRKKAIETGTGYPNFIQKNSVVDMVQKEAETRYQPQVYLPPNNYSVHDFVSL